jgi:hypothetical protein
MTMARLTELEDILEELLMGALDHEDKVLSGNYAQIP